VVRTESDGARGKLDGGVVVVEGAGVEADRLVKLKKEAIVTVGGVVE